jgi:predicted nucleotidyltransferase
VLALEINQEELASLCRRYGVTRLAVFGSAVTGGFGDGSDVDFLVEFPDNTDIGLMEFAQLQTELSRLVGRDADLVCLESLENPYRRHNITSTAETLYAL